MTDSLKRRIDIGCGGHVRHIRPLDHHHFNPERACSRDLGIARRPAAILRDHGVNSMVTQQLEVGSFIERSPVENVGCVRDRKRGINGLDRPDQIMMPGRILRYTRLLPPKGQEDAARRLAKCGNGRCRALGFDPAVPLLALPGRAAQGQKGNPSPSARLGRIAGHVGGKGMRGVDQKADLIVLHPARQPLRPAKATASHRHGHGYGRTGAARQRKRDVQVLAAREPLGQLARLCRTAQNQDVVHG